MNTTYNDVMQIDKDILISCLVVIVGILGYFLRAFVSRVDKLETRLDATDSRLNLAVTTQIGHDKDLVQVKEMVKDIKDLLHDQDRRREIFLSQIPQKFTEAAAVQLSQIMTKLEVMEHRLGTMEAEKKH